MTSTKSTFEKYVDNPARRRVFEEERLLVDATELLSTVMEIRRIKKADLAERLGKSKAYVTQMLRGNQNLTLRTLADVFYVLDCRLRMAAEPFAAGAGFITSSPWSLTQQVSNTTLEDEGSPEEFIEGMAA